MSFALLSSLIVMLSSAAFAQTSDKPTRTPDPRATYWTPPPAPFVIRVQRVARLATLNFGALGIGSIATDSEGNLYLGDGLQTVLVLAPDLSEVRRLRALQPFALAFNQRGELIIGQRVQATLRRYTTQGEFLGRLWEQPEALLDAFTIAPSGDFYILWTRVNPPIVTYLTRLSAEGQLIFTREFGRPRRSTDAVHGIIVTADNQLGVFLTGYDFSDSAHAAYVTLSAEGDLLLRRAPLPSLDRLQAPTVPLSLPNGEMVAHSTNYIHWWSAEKQLRAALFSDAARAGYPRAELARRSALAAQPDGRTLYVAEVLNDGSLGLSLVQLQQR
ncbi:MAG: hypothetical protein NZ571_00325 [Anaerolineae bacterium]|nr:hypothetical protein [Anaerolineae bacterium]